MKNKEFYVKLGKYIAYILRHGATQENVEIDKEGWVSVEALIAKAQEEGYNCNIEDVRHVVETNSKKRFQFNEGETFIRAVQGHSSDAVNISFAETVPPDVLFHGTATQFLESIMSGGIKKMNRQYVHLSSNIDTAHSVGQRHGKVIILNIDAARMHKEGIKFYLSENGVWLTEYIDSKYILKA